MSLHFLFEITIGSFVVELLVFKVGQFSRGIQVVGGLRLPR